MTVRSVLRGGEGGGAGVGSESMAGSVRLPYYTPRAGQRRWWIPGPHFHKAAGPLGSRGGVQRRDDIRDHNKFSPVEGWSPEMVSLEAKSSGLGLARAMRAGDSPISRANCGCGDFILERAR